MLKLFGVILLCVACIQSATINKSLKIKNYKRKIDISSQIVKIVDEISLENTGSSKVTSFLVAVEPSLQEYLANIDAKVKTAAKQDDDEEEDNGKLTVKQVRVAEKKDAALYEVSLGEGTSVAPGKTQLVTVESVYTHALVPFPREISQSDKQLVKFRANHLAFAAYPSDKQQTTVTLASNKVEAYSKKKPTSLSDTTLTYGPYENIQPFSEDEMSVHYENNAPFLTVVSLERVVEVSHWGNVAVEEVVDVLHSGAALRGPFSRYDFQRDPASGLAAVKSFKTVLPAAAADVYYRDEIGNISTSHLKEHDDYVEVELRPRFPLFGGWKTRYTLGYNVPSYEYLYNDGDQFALKMRFIDHVFDDMVVDSATVKIILPENSKNVKVQTPYPVTREADTLRPTYLDTTGRIVITLTKQGLTEAHIQDFQVDYEFSKLLMLREPLLIVGAFFLLFMAIIIYVRLDFSISKDEQSESRARVAGIVEQAAVQVGRRGALYAQYDAMVAAFKQSKDAGRLAHDRKRLDMEAKAATIIVQELVARLKLESGAGEVVAKLTEVQRLERSARDLVAQMIGFAEKVVGGKMTKVQYVDMEKAVGAKRDDLTSKIDAIVNTL